MTAIKKYVEQEFAEICCSACGIVFYVPSFWHQNRRETHESFYCPNGCSRYYPAKSEKEQLQDRLNAALSRENQERQQREALEKKLARVEKGTCPHCKRHFANLARHIKCKHEKKA